MKEKYKDLLKEKCKLFFVVDLAGIKTQKLWFERFISGTEVYIYSVLELHFFCSSEILEKIGRTARDTLDIFKYFDLFEERISHQNFLGIVINYSETQRFYIIYSVINLLILCHILSTGVGYLTVLFFGYKKQTLLYFNGKIDY